MRLSVELTWEPHLQPIIFFQRLADVEAVDDRGDKLVVDSPEAEIETPVDALRSAITFTIPFALPPREVKTIARIKGKLNAVVAGKIAEFAFANLTDAKNVEKRTAEATVVLEQARTSENACEIFVRVRFDHAHDALASHRGWILGNPAFLKNSTGEKIAYTRQETTRRTNNEIGLMYVFPVANLPADMTFIYQTPSAILSTDVEYELRGLDLP
ncbi:MAG: hypothetical protein ACWGMZ_09290 [Thermoguttaceae bacterium]